MVFFDTNTIENNKTLFILLFNMLCFFIEMSAADLFYMSLNIPIKKIIIEHVMQYNYMFFFIYIH